MTRDLFQSSGLKCSVSWHPWPKAFPADCLCYVPKEHCACLVPAVSPCTMALQVLTHSFVPSQQPSMRAGLDHLCMVQVRC